MTSHDVQSLEIALKRARQLKLMPELLVRDAEFPNMRECMLMNKPFPSHDGYHPYYIAFCMLDKEHGTCRFKHWLSIGLIHPQKVRFFHVFTALRIELLVRTRRWFPPMISTSTPINWDIVEMLCDGGADMHVGCESLLAYDCMVGDPFPEVRAILFRRGVHKLRGMKWIGEEEARVVGILAFLGMCCNQSEDLRVSMWGVTSGIHTAMVKKYTPNEMWHIHTSMGKGRESAYTRVLEYARAGASLNQGPYNILHILADSILTCGMNEIPNNSERCETMRELIELGADVNQVTTMPFNEYVVDPNVSAEVVAVTDARMKDKEWRHRPRRVLDLLPYRGFKMDIAEMLISRGALCEQPSSPWWHMAHTRRSLALLACRTELPDDIIRLLRGALGPYGDKSRPSVMVKFGVVVNASTGELNLIVN